jgi:FkbM family methyltransferase
MRRIRIILYWLFTKKNNVSLTELIKFFFKPQVRGIASRYLKNIEEKERYYEITFNPIARTLYWPKACAVDGIYQVTSETFDQEDWHFYQKDHTKVEQNEQLLDIGAAEGLFALSVADKCKMIYLVEPNDYFAEALKKTFSFCVDKVQIFNLAVGSSEGEISFDQNSLSGKISGNEATANKKRIATIDKLLPDASVTYLKADLEGFELEMLKGAENLIKRNKPKIAITTYHPENDAEEIIRLIKSFVPSYNHYVKGIIHTAPKPVMIHFWIDSSD